MRKLLYTRSQKSEPLSFCHNFIKCCKCQVVQKFSDPDPNPDHLKIYSVRRLTLHRWILWHLDNRCHIWAERWSTMRYLITFHQREQNWQTANLWRCAAPSWRGWWSGWWEWCQCASLPVQFQPQTVPLLPDPAGSTYIVANTFTYLSALSHTHTRTWGARHGRGHCSHKNLAG